MTPEEHLALARAEYEQAQKHSEHAQDHHAHERLAFAQTEALLAIAAKLIEPRKRKWPRLRP